MTFLSADRVLSLISDRMMVDEYMQQVGLLVMGVCKWMHKDYWSAIGSYLRPGFLMTDDLVHDVCLLSRELLCTHVPDVRIVGEDYARCDFCSEGRTGKPDKLLLSCYRSELFRQTIQKYTGPNFTVSWDTVSKQLAPLLLERTLTSESVNMICMPINMDCIPLAPLEFAEGQKVQEVLKNVARYGLPKLLRIRWIHVTKRAVIPELTLEEFQT